MALLIRTVWCFETLFGSGKVSLSTLPDDIGDPSANCGLYRSFLPLVGNPVLPTNWMEIKLPVALESIIAVVLYPLMLIDVLTCVLYSANRIFVFGEISPNLLAHPLNTWD
jgi:hypothetical protein